MADSSPPSTLGRRQVLQVAGTAGLTAAAACTVSNVPYYVDPTTGGELPDGGVAADSPFGGPGPDGGGGPGVDGNPGPGMDASQGVDTGGGPQDSSGSPKDSSPDTNPPPPVCTTNSNTLKVSLAQYPALKQTGGMAQLNDSRYSDPKCGGQDFYVVATGPGKFAAFSITCTHACCTLQASGSQLSCPCHGATFEVATGAHLSGPGSQLPSIPTCTDGTSVYVQLA